ncbi:MAG: hypothetical protein QHC40_07895 [Sphingobium sp.]|nr:hypothetical protein [Sphingobium sp.]
MITKEVVLLLGLPGLALLSACDVQKAIDQQTADFQQDIEQKAQVEMTKIQRQVAEDAAHQYYMTLQSGTAMDQCVQAGMVSAAYLQNQDQAQYNRWKTTEKIDCKAAGIPN